MRVFVVIEDLSNIGIYESRELVERSLEPDDVPRCRVFDSEGMAYEVIVETSQWWNPKLTRVVEPAMREAADELKAILLEWWEGMPEEARAYPESQRLRGIWKKLCSQ